MWVKWNSYCNVTKHFVEAFTGNLLATNVYCLNELRYSVIHFERESVLWYGVWCHLVNVLKILVRFLGVPAVEYYIILNAGDCWVSSSLASWYIDNVLLVGEQIVQATPKTIISFFGDLSQIGPEKLNDNLWDPPNCYNITDNLQINLTNDTNHLSEYSVTS